MDIFSNYFITIYAAQKNLIAQGNTLRMFIKNSIEISSFDFTRIVYCIMTSYLVVATPLLPKSYKLPPLTSIEVSPLAMLFL